MCAAFGFYQERAKDYWTKRYELTKFPDHEWKSYNIRPTMEGYVILRKSPKQAVTMRFGIKAPWNDKVPLYNAKSETVAEKGTFKKLFQENRCLVIADVFYEWHKTKIDGQDFKQPYAFALKDGETFTFAGIYDDAGNFSILTTTPNELLEPIHNRMPVILDPEEADEYLNPDMEIEQLLALLKPYSADKMRKWAISSLVSYVKNNFPEILNPVNDK